MSMHIQSAFKINAPPAEAWRLLTDIARVGPCFPGAEIGEAQGDGMYRANFKVRLGPVSLSFAGKVGFAELDQAKGLAVIAASGSDTKGRGGARGTVRCQLSPEGPGTGVALDSSVELSGSVAQYGRGEAMIADLTQQLVNRFAENLEALTASQEPAAEPSASASAAPMSADTALPSTPAAAPSARPPAAEAKDGGMLAGVLWRAVLRFFGRLFGRTH
ncbi:MAG: SRPBCC family protein [Betaproteobacteria bacterium]|nr:SRPBCC family protein [Betaproteobacteria bacterium]